MVFSDESLDFDIIRGFRLVSIDHLRWELQFLKFHRSKLGGSGSLTTLLERTVVSRRGQQALCSRIRK